VVFALSPLTFLLRTWKLNTAEDERGVGLVCHEYFECCTAALPGMCLCLD
jgi:hypothetical protein